MPFHFNYSSQAGQVWQVFRLYLFLFDKTHFKKLLVDGHKKSHLMSGKKTLLVLGPGGKFAVLLAVLCLQCRFFFHLVTDKNTFS